MKIKIIALGKVHEQYLKDGINGNETPISVWPVVGLTKTDLSVRINKDIFKLNKK